MLLDVHKSIPQSWMESLLPDREVLSCDPAWGSPAPAGTNLVLRCAELSPSIHLCHRQEWESSFWHEEGFHFSIPFGTAPTGWGGSALCHIQWTLLCWSPLEAVTVLMVGVHVIHYWEEPFSSPQAEKSWGGISAPTAALQRPEKHSKALNGNREYPLQGVSGVQSRLRKERLIFQRQGRLVCAFEWKASTARVADSGILQDHFLALAGGDRVQKWLKSSQFQ